MCWDVGHHEGDSHQVSNRQDILKVGCHGVVLHGHEEGVENNANGDGKVYERVHHNQVHNLLDL